jgi:hypothetical protein
MLLMDQPRAKLGLSTKALSGDRNPILDAGKHCDLPIGDMAREDDHPPAGCDRPIHMFEAVRLDPPARFEDADVP